MKVRAEFEQLKFHKSFSYNYQKVETFKYIFSLISKPLKPKIKFFDILNTMTTTFSENFAYLSVIGNIILNKKLYNQERRID